MSKKDKAFTLRSIIFGLIGVFIIAGLTKFLGDHLKLKFVIEGQLPIVAVTYLILLNIIYIPLARRFFPGGALSPKEMVVVATMTLISCIFGLNEYIPIVLAHIILPFANYNSFPQWQKYGILEYIPKKIIPLAGKIDETVFEGFKMGLSKDGVSLIKFSEIPFKAWLSAAAYWVPLILFMVIMLVALALVIHRQWAVNEQLAYPISNIFNAIIHRKAKGFISEIFTMKLFYAGFGIAAFIYIYNYIQAWFPSNLNPIPLKWSMELWKIFPSIPKAQLWRLQDGFIFLSGIGIAYLISTEISLSIGLNYVIYGIFAIQIYKATGAPPAANNFHQSIVGAFIAYFIILIILGRSYYRLVFSNALGIGKASPENKDAVYAARIFLITFLGFIIMLSLMGMDWIIALFFSIAIVLLFTVYTRMTCETGIPILQAKFDTGNLLTKIFGHGFMGAKGISTSYFFEGALVDMRMSPMAYAATSFKLSEDHKIRKRAIFKIILITLIIAFIIGTGACFWQFYSWGAVENPWTFSHAWRLPIVRGVKEVVNLDNMGLIEETSKATGMAKFKYFMPDMKGIKYLIFGVLMVTLFYALRVRFRWWPLHPIIFLMWNTWFASNMAWSFLIGWAIKSLVVKFAGGKVYNNIKPFFIGLILGEVGILGLTIIFGALYSIITGNQPPAFYSLFRPF